MWIWHLILYTAKVIIIIKANKLLYCPYIQDFGLTMYDGYVSLLADVKYGVFHILPLILLNQTACIYENIAIYFSEP